MSHTPTLIKVSTAERGAEPTSVPRVGVLMSTYNGAKHLQEQIDTIAAQEGVQIAMFVRDDGSSDDTGDLLRQLSKRPYGCIQSWKVELEENVGFLASFERLLSCASDCDYYAFSDQDDFWLPQKLVRAIGLLEQHEGAELYSSAVEIVDQELNPIGHNTFPGLAYTIPAELIRHRLAGHTMVWSDALQKRIIDLGALPCWSHDQHVVIAALLSGMDMVFDEDTNVLHRRLLTSVTPGGAGISKRIAHEARMLWNPGHAWNRSALALKILSLGGANLQGDDARFLKECAARKRFALLRDPACDCGLSLGNAEARLSVLLGRF